ncbi:MAG: 2-haloacid dehalogenase [Polaromonas sp.]|jgi:2-haloacid dehalogenase
MTITTVVFDAYGTLFDVAGAARAMAEQPGRDEFSEHWQEIAAGWRTKQLEYSWLRAAAGTHCDFWDVTKDGLDWALEARGLGDDLALREDLLALYWELPPYHDGLRALALLKATGFQTAILSNGSPDMLDGAVNSAGLEMLLDAVLSVEDVGVFKPSSKVYEMVGARFDVTPDQVLFVSSNGWDAAFAAHYGFVTAWVNRAGVPMDRLPGTPTHVLSDLSTIPDLAKV